MTFETAPVRPPLSFWTIAGLGLAWNMFGAYLYMLSKIDPEAALQGVTPAMRDYVAAMPLWAHLGWSLGIWGSVLGSVLMLARSRHATGAFMVSLIGALASFAAQAMAGVLETGLAATIIAVIAFLWWFCRKEAGNGSLR
ncbi:MAG: hypothetical protein ABL914_13505 [Novosphingobium sp.]|uniref:hypothetical protein n=1 Tax=Novosphingobium sp. TaxID=1874826 RepID=UPI0032BF0BDC